MGNILFRFTGPNVKIVRKLKDTNNLGYYYLEETNCDEIKNQILRVEEWKKRGSTFYKEFKNEIDPANHKYQIFGYIRDRDHLGRPRPHGKLAFIDIRRKEVIIFEIQLRSRGDGNEMCMLESEASLEIFNHDHPPEIYRKISAGETKLNLDQLRLLAISCAPKRYTKIYNDCIAFIRSMTSEIMTNEYYGHDRTWDQVKHEFVALVDLPGSKIEGKARNNRLAEPKRLLIAYSSLLVDHYGMTGRLATLGIFICVIFLIFRYVIAHIF